MNFPKEDEFIDYEGKKRHFTYQVNKTAIGCTVYATEKVENGYEFSGYSPTDPFDILGELRSKIKKRLSTKYLQEQNGEFSFSHDQAIGHISSGGVVIDGKFIPFDDLSNMMQTYEGFTFNLKITE
ncbi:MAG: hypothetical protein HFP81_02430 [Methylococcales symbiont of Hymedesmia sp. n. MRB-2018]|nr:MAG: hypothetical protein HFP78_00310 [Methylococcales symbiont of Hymedesmia sp. n. MRB-2018]KAF3984389.1 MAG: hypothetical protein HFP81_02430 [Methylococcales symbiont of Hymedesmia sp. n. MRB-2018]ORU94729.1 MAG: hypothetical protein A6F72_09115 [Cycloclasticus sp. symbiont of Poecilosclerida sp. N]